MNERFLVVMISIAIISFAVNLPLGYLREGVRKFSAIWFIYVHLSIPLIAYLRIRNGVRMSTIPIFIFAAVLGQLTGGRLRGREEG